MRYLFITICLLFIGITTQAQQNRSLRAGTNSNGSIIGYLEVPDIPGESKQAGYEDQIEILHLEFETETAASSGRTKGRTKVSPIRITKELESSSPYLFDASVRGKVFDEVTIELTTNIAGRKEALYTITLGRVVIQKVQADYPDENGKMVEHVSFYYESINIIYREYNSDGSLGDEHEIEYDVASGV